MLLFNFFNWNPTVIDCIIADGIIKSQVRINENVSWMAIQSSGCKVLRSRRTIERTPSNLSEFRPYVLVLTWGNITNNTRMYEAVLTDLLMMVWLERRTFNSPRYGERMRWIQSEEWDDDCTFALPTPDRDECDEPSQVFPTRIIVIDRF